MISADTVLPDAWNPQSLNRFSYAFNSPLKFTDPGGHCPDGDSACWEQLNVIQDKYKVRIEPSELWKTQELQWMMKAFDMILGAVGNNIDKLQSLTGINAVVFKRVEQIAGHENDAGVYTTGKGLVQLASSAFNSEQAALGTIIHEVGHAIDDRSSGRLKSRFSEMTGASCTGVSVLGNCLFGSWAPGGDIVSGYAATNPAEEFAETFTAFVVDKCLSGDRDLFSQEYHRSSDIRQRKMRPVDRLLEDQYHLTQYERNARWWVPEGVFGW